ncbi:MAG TPA: YicC family protein [Rhodocyclaceae bacterium]|nr:YicC family protein [Rhodocyclaceae bacterium]
MIKSMTGYAAQSRELAQFSLHLELKSVNARFLDIHFRIGDELRFLELPLRELITSRAGRGKVECRLQMQASTARPRELVPNATMLGHLKDLEAVVRREMPAAAPLGVADILRWPGILGEEAVDPEVLQAACMELAGAAVAEFVASREREGEKLAAMLRERVTRMRDLVAQAEPLLPQALADYRERLSQKLREAVASLDEERIRQEVGVFATRIDVAEELSRLSTHLDETERILRQGGAAGKRLDFLMQELNREANTLSSKSVSGQVTAIALELKLLIEQMREQVQNIE